MERRHSSGFTLIEILVVVVIVAMVTSIAILSVNWLGSDRDLDSEARRLASLVTIVQDEAMMQGREFGLEFTLGAYRFVEYDALSSRWVEVFDDRLLRARELPDDVEFELFLESKRIVLAADPAEIGDDDKDSKEYAPHVLIYSSGDLSPFELALTRMTNQDTLALQADMLGTITIGEDEE